MRVSSTYLTAIMTRSFERNSGKISKIIEQQSTGKRVNLPSDDPIASSQLVNLQRENSALKQFQSNISRLQTSLSQQETVVTAINQQTDAIIDDLLSAANASHSRADMGSFAHSIDGKIESVIAALNQKNEDNHALFGGTLSDIQPIVFDAKTQQYRYQGNDQTRETTVANGINIKENTLMSGVFSKAGSDLEVLNQLTALSSKMKNSKIVPSSYLAELQSAHEMMLQASKKLGATFTDLGGRQNRLSMLAEAHTDIATSNSQAMDELANSNPAQASTDLNLYKMSIQASGMTYMKISQLSLFNYMS